MVVHPLAQNRLPASEAALTKRHKPKNEIFQVLLLCYLQIERIHYISIQKHCRPWLTLVGALELYITLGVLSFNHLASDFFIPALVTVFKSLYLIHSHLALSSRSFVLLHFTFSSVINFELVFVNNIKYV